MKVTRRLVALVGRLRRAREPLSRERIRAEMAPLGAWEGTRDRARRKLARDLDRLGDLGLTVRWYSAKWGYVRDDRARSPKRVELAPDEAALLREAASLVVRDGANPFGPDVVGLLERFDPGGSVELAVHHPDRDIPPGLVTSPTVHRRSWRPRCPGPRRHHTAP